MYFPVVVYFPYRRCFIHICLTFCVARLGLASFCNSHWDCICISFLLVLSFIFIIHARVIPCSLFGKGLAASFKVSWTHVWVCAVRMLSIVLRYETYHSRHLIWVRINLTYPTQCIHCWLYVYLVLAKYLHTGNILVIVLWSAIYSLYFAFSNRIKLQATTFRTILDRTVVS